MKKIIISSNRILKNIKQTIVLKINLIFVINLSLFFLVLNKPILAEINSNELPTCIVVTHCVNEKWQVEDLDNAFQKAENFISESPRTKIIERSNNYIHAEATTRWMHYIDDLEVKALKESSSIQIRSESRVGIGDNGVNKKRVNNLVKKMNLKSINR